MKHLKSGNNYNHSHNISNLKHQIKLINCLFCVNNIGKREGNHWKLLLIICFLNYPKYVKTTQRNKIYCMESFREWNMHKKLNNMLIPLGKWLWLGEWLWINKYRLLNYFILFYCIVHFVIFCIICLFLIN